jgi:putative ATPase
MLEAGEDARFIARRLIVHASEDIGLADSQALLVAVAAAHAVEHVGLPEARLNLAHATLYLARAPKSNSVYTAIGTALEDAPSPEPVPLHLRDASYRGARDLGHGKGYRYPHDEPGQRVEQAYRPTKVSDHVYYEPSGQGDDVPVEPGTGEPVAGTPSRPEGPDG